MKKSSDVSRGTSEDLGLPAIRFAFRTYFAAVSEGCSAAEEAYAPPVDADPPFPDAPAAAEPSDGAEPGAPADVEAAGDPAAGV